MQLESWSTQKDLPEFDRIIHKGIGNLKLIKGDSYGIAIYSKLDIVDKVKFEVLGRELRIKMIDPIETGFKSLVNLKVPDLEIEVTFKNIEEVLQKGVGRIFSDSVLELYKLKVENKGIGEVNLNIDVGQLVSNMNGVGSIVLQGSAENHECLLKGTGKIDARLMEAEEVHVVSNGIGNIEIFASKKLIAELKGIGKILFYGNPDKVESRINGLGSIVAGI